MSPTEAVKTIVQCDFDGTITQQDVSFLILDAFADGDWRRLLREYQEGRISVGRFNTSAFAMVNENRPNLIRFVREKARTRDGLCELVQYCRMKGFRFVIVSNGLDFYIKIILADMGLKNVEVLAAQTRFSSSGIDARYIGPEGSQLQDGFKETYTRLFLEKGYRLIYVGNGPSDIPSARLAHHTFATGQLLAYCRQTKLNCIPFSDLNDIFKGLELL